MRVNPTDFPVSLVLIALILSLPAVASAGGEEPASLERAVFWQGDGIRVFLVQGEAWEFHLTVLSLEPLRVVYRTRRNSGEPVENVLVPGESMSPGITDYTFQHRFSRTTIWMGLDFFRGDRKLENLSRVFSGGLREALDRVERSMELRPPPDP